MSEITNPPPDEHSIPDNAASGSSGISNPPLDDGGGGAALDEHLNPDPKTLPGAAGQKTAPGAGPQIENPPPWEAASAPAAPEHEARALEPLNPPVATSTSKTVKSEKSTTTKRRAPTKKTRK